MRFGLVNGSTAQSFIFFSFSVASLPSEQRDAESWMVAASIEERHGVVATRMEVGMTPVRSRGETVDVCGRFDCLQVW